MLKDFVKCNYYVYTCTFSLGFIARDVLTGVAETCRRKQALWNNQRQIRLETGNKKNKKKRFPILSLSVFSSVLFFCSLDNFVWC